LCIYYITGSFVYYCICLYIFILRMLECFDMGLSLFFFEDVTARQMSVNFILIYCFIAKRAILIFSFKLTRLTAFLIGKIPAAFIVALIS